ncbi:PilZ domain-containing protein, partial [Xanthomonas sacchari]
LQPSDWLPDHLELPVRVLAEAATAGVVQLWLRFETQPPGLEEALERHLFRLHRRQIADSRRAR